MAPRLLYSLSDYKPLFVGKGFPALGSAAEWSLLNWQSLLYYRRGEGVNQHSLFVAVDILHFNASYPDALGGDETTTLRASDHDPLEGRFRFP